MTPWRKLAAESIGTAFLLAMVVGSGIMGERLAGGNEAITLLANSLATFRRKNSTLEDQCGRDEMPMQ